MKKFADITTEDIINAAEIIQTVCDNYECRYCPFGNESDKCLIQEFAPTDWEIESTLIWRVIH